MRKFKRDEFEHPSFCAVWKTEFNFDEMKEEHVIQKKDMIELKAGSGLFDMAVKNIIDSFDPQTEGAKKVEESLKYGIICDKTAFYLELKQKNKMSQGETITSKLNFSHILTISAYKDQFIETKVTKEIQIAGTSYDLTSFRGNSPDMKLI